MSEKECLCETTGLVQDPVVNNNRYRSDYNVDMWREMKKRWFMLGVLVSVAGAVAAPSLGAPGGLLHAEYLIYLPLSNIYYAAGGGRAPPPRRRLYALTVFHAHLAAPALCLAAVTALRDAALDYRVIEGAMLASAGTPCVWLPLAVSARDAAPALVAVNYVAALVIVPLSHLLLCGRFPVTPILGIVVTMLAVAPPLALGTYRPAWRSGLARPKLSALLLLYSECCVLLRDAEGMLGVWDVLATLFLELSWICAVAASSSLYLRCGVLNAAEARALLLTALPKSTHAGWEYSTTCKPTGLSQLPSVFLAPAQALLLAAVYPEEPDDQLPR